MQYHENDTVGVVYSQTPAYGRRQLSQSQHTHFLSGRLHA